ESPAPSCMVRGFDGPGVSGHVVLVAVESCHAQRERPFLVSPEGVLHPHPAACAEVDPAERVTLRGREEEGRPPGLGIEVELEPAPLVAGDLLPLAPAVAYAPGPLQFVEVSPQVRDLEARSEEDGLVVPGRAGEGQ